MNRRRLFAFLGAPALLTWPLVEKASAEDTNGNKITISDDGKVTIGPWQFWVEPDNRACVADLTDDSEHPLVKFGPHLRRFSVDPWPTS